MPNVSVIIPCHNYARYLPEAVRSVAEQTYRDFEIVIVNDGSTDDTVTVALGLIEEYPDIEIRLVNLEKSGAPTARNKGIEACSGVYILPLDADDLLRPRYLEKTVDALESGADMACTWTEKFGNDSGVLKPGTLDRLSVMKLAGPPVTALLRKSAWAEVGGYKPYMKWGGQDWEFNCSLHEAGYKAVVIPEPLFMWRRHGTSMSIDMSKNHALDTHTRIKLLHPRIFEPKLHGLHPSLARAVIRAKYHTIARVSSFIYVRFPRLHRLLNRIKYSFIR